jgi:hypothetical protein
MCYNRTQEMARERFDPDLLDAWLFGEPVFFPPRRRARPTG